MPEPSEFDQHVQKRHRAHPRGWETGIQWNGAEGTITATAVEEPDPAIWRELIADWGLDPARCEVVPGSVQIRAWDTNVGGGDIQRLKYYRATLRARSEDVAQADVDSLVKIATKKRPATRQKSTVTAAVDRSFVALLSDWQVGNGEAGGSEQIVEQLRASIDKSVARAKALRKIGAGADTAYLLGLGDLAEGCTGFYPMQEYSTDLTVREQDRVVRHLLLAWVDAFVDAGYRVVALGVPGNHGEQRRSGKAFTAFSDNRDVQAFEILAEVCDQNPDRYGDVHFPQVLDRYDMTATLDISGVPVSAAHGHQFKRGASAAQAKIEGWLRGQALGRQSAADCSILFCGHLHHFVASEATGRTVFQAPASDAGSAWWTAQTGQHSPAGTLTMNIGTACGPRGWNDLAIL